jgi:hypothetical protein
MSQSRNDPSFWVTSLFSVLGIALSFCFIDLPAAGAAVPEYTIAFTTACLQAM